MPFDVQIEMPLGDGERDGDAAFETRGEVVDEVSGEGVDGEVFAAMNAPPLELAKQNANVAVRVDGDAFGQLAGAMQPIGIRQTDFNPSRHPSGEIAHH